MRPVATGRPGTPVIPAGWEAASSGPLAGTRTAVVSLRKPGTTQQFDEASQTTITTPFAPYAAAQPARIQALTTIRQPVEAAGDTVEVQGYLVALDRALGGVKPGDQVDVTSCSDADLQGRTLTVTDVLRGSLLFERDLFCTLNN